jgi:hypothetical protein
MRRAFLIGFAAFGLCLATGAQAQNPHKMVGPDGKLDMTTCSFCHEEDLTLSRSKEETCTLCHAAIPHGGAAPHLAASAEAVKERLPKPGPGVPELPLTDSGKIYCGTCHLFHDPAVADEQWLTKGWIPPKTGIPEAVRESLVKRIDAVAEKYGEKKSDVAHFAEKGTRQLRLPIEGGKLCLQCHGYLFGDGSK